jgi:translation initiation factor 1 (eIF-1/SUI1)
MGGELKGKPSLQDCRDFEFKIQEIRIAFEKAISARKKKHFVDAFNEFNERFAELEEMFKRKNLDTGLLYKYFPEVGYMERKVIERSKLWA